MSDFEKVSEPIMKGVQQINEEAAAAINPGRKTIVEQEVNEEINTHRLVLRIIVDGKIQAEVIGPWASFVEVATVNEYRAFHPRYLLDGLPGFFEKCVG